MQSSGVRRFYSHSETEHCFNGIVSAGRSAFCLWERLRWDGGPEIVLVVQGVRLIWMPKDAGPILRHEGEWMAQCKLGDSDRRRANSGDCSHARQPVTLTIGNCRM